MRSKSLPTRKSIGQFIKSARLARELRQAEFAALMGVSQAKLSKMEAGISVPDILDWVRFCEAAGIGGASGESVLKPGGYFVEIKSIRPAPDANPSIF